MLNKIKNWFIRLFDKVGWNTRIAMFLIICSLIDNYWFNGFLTNLIGDAYKNDIFKYIFLIIFILFKWFLFYWSVNLEKEKRILLYSFIFSLPFALISVSPLINVFLHTELFLAGALLLLLYSFLEDLIYKEIDLQTIDNFFPYFFFVGIISLIAGLVDKNVFTAISILMSFIAFLMDKKELAVMFNIKEDQIEKATVSHLKVFFYLLIINLILIIVFTDGEHMGPHINSIINNTLPILKDKSQNQVFRDILTLLIFGGIRLVFSIGLLLVEAHLFRKFKPTIAKSLSNPIRFF